MVKQTWFGSENFFISFIQLDRKFDDKLRLIELHQFVPVLFRNDQISVSIKEIVIKLGN